MASKQLLHIMSSKQSGHCDSSDELDCSLSAMFAPWYRGARGLRDDKRGLSNRAPERRGNTFRQHGGEAGASHTNLVQNACTCVQF